MGGVYSSGLSHPTQLQRGLPSCNPALPGPGGTPFSVPVHSNVAQPRPFRYTPAAPAPCASDFQPPYFPPPYCGSVPQQPAFDFALPQYQYLDPYPHHHHHHHHPLNVPPQYAAPSVPYSSTVAAPNSGGVEDRYASYYSDPSSALKNSGSSFPDPSGSSGTTYDQALHGSGACLEYVSLRRPDMISTKVHHQAIENDLGMQGQQENINDDSNRVRRYRSCLAP